MTTEGLDEVLDLYQAAMDAAGEHLASIVHGAIIEEYKRRESRIPVHTGALRKALVNPNDRFHSAVVVVTRKGWALEVGVKGNWGNSAPKKERRKKVADGKGDPKDRERKRRKPTGTSNALRATVFQGQQKRIIQPVTRRVVEIVHEAYEGAISSGNELTGDIALGKVAKRNKRKRRVRRGRGGRR